jgi:N-acetylmuramoyl-L-alanine amidase
MLRALSGLIISIFIFFTLSSFNSGTNPAAIKLRTIVIDPGHGGQYPGTRGLISVEKDVTLEISLKLGEAIKKTFPDTKVVFTICTMTCMDAPRLPTRQKVIYLSAYIAMLRLIHREATMKKGSSVIKKSLYMSAKVRRNIKNGLTHLFMNLIG